MTKSQRDELLRSVSSVYSLIQKARVGEASLEAPAIGPKYGFTGGVAPRLSPLPFDDSEVEAALRHIEEAAQRASRLEGAASGLAKALEAVRGLVPLIAGL